MSSTPEVWKIPLEKEMAAHSSILAWEIPWTEEPGRPQSMGLQESDTTERLSTRTHSAELCREGSGNPLQCSCLENPRDGGAWWAAIYEVAESDRTKVTYQQQQQQSGTSGKYLPADAGDARDASLMPGSGRSPGGGNGNPLQYFLPGKFHGQRSLAGYSPRGHKESDTTE